jgi:hypothetical protein
MRQIINSVKSLKKTVAVLALLGTASVSMAQFAPGNGGNFGGGYPQPAPGGYGPAPVNTNGPMGPTGPAYQQVDIRQVLPGQWRDTSGNVFNFSPDGTGTYGNAPFRWQADQQTVIIAGSRGQVAIQYRIDGRDRISVLCEGQPDVITRVQAGPNGPGGYGPATPASYPTPGGYGPTGPTGPVSPTTPGGFGPGGAGTVDLGGDQPGFGGNGGYNPGNGGFNPNGGYAPNGPTNNAPGMNANASARIVGVWSDGSQTLEFRPDGTAIMMGQPMQFTADATNITMRSGTAAIPFPYRFDGNRLVISVAGQDMALTRIR